MDRNTQIFLIVLSSFISFVLCSCCARYIKYIYIRKKEHQKILFFRTKLIAKNIIKPINYEEVKDETRPSQIIGLENV